MRDTRLGKIYIATEFLTSDEKELKETLHVFFSKVVPLKIDTELFSNRTLIIGTCDSFRKVSEGEKIPMYEALFTMEEAGLLNISFKEISDITSEHFNI